MKAQAPRMGRCQPARPGRGAARPGAGGRRSRGGVREILERVRERGGRRRPASRPSASARRSPETAAGRCRGGRRGARAARARGARGAAHSPPRTSRPSRARDGGLSAAASAELPQGQRVEIRNESRSPRRASTRRAAAPPIRRPSLMCCIPARVAGVQRIAVASPPGASGRRQRTGRWPPRRSRAWRRSTPWAAPRRSARSPSAPRASSGWTSIAGPGNRYVHGGQAPGCSATSGSTASPGPSELMRGRRWHRRRRTAVALDLLAQAEHGADAPLVASRPSRRCSTGSPSAVEELAADRPERRGRPAGARRPRRDLAVALELADAFAPEHLELICADADEIAAAVARRRLRVRRPRRRRPPSATTPPGSNHVLPTGGAARFGGPLGPRAFRRRTRAVTIRPAPPPRLAPVRRRRWPAPRDFPCTASPRRARASE